MRYHATALALLVLTTTTPAQAACIDDNSADMSCNAPSPARFMSVEPSSGGLSDGARLPDNAMVLINTAYYGLPPVESGWWYFKADGQIYRANPSTRVILERVTHLANAAFKS